MADLTIFKTIKGSRIDVAVAPEGLPANPALGWQASDFANFDALSTSVTGDKVAMTNIPYTDTAPVPDGTKPIDAIDTPQFGIVNEPGDETFAPLTFGVYQTVDNKDGAEMFRTAYRSGGTLIYRFIDEDGATGVFCAVHVSQALRGNVLNGRASVAVSLAVQPGGSHDLPVSENGA